MLKNTKILYRIALSALIPLITLTGIAAYEISIKWAMRSEMTRLEPVVEGVGKLSRLVHELQRERGLSSAFLASKGAQMRGELAEQRKRTDAERATGLTVLDDLRRSGAAELSAATQASQEILAQLDQRRAEVD